MNDPFFLIIFLKQHQVSDVPIDNNTPAPPHHNPLPIPIKNARILRPHTIAPSGKPHDLNGIGRGGVEYGNDTISNKGWRKGPFLFNGSSGPQNLIWVVY
jgi:hypothetical protein